MTVIEKIFEVSKKLPNTLQKEVLDFAEYLVYRKIEGDTHSLNFGLKIHKRFQELKFDELVIPLRSIIRNPPDLHLNETDFLGIEDLENINPWKLTH